MGKTARKPAVQKQSGPAAKKPAAKKVARWNGVPSLKDDRREAILRSVANVLRNSRLSSLTIKQVADELGRLSETYGVDEFFLWHHVGYFPQEVEMAMLEEFAAAAPMVPAKALA